MSQENPGMTRVGIEPGISRLIAGYLFHCAIMLIHKMRSKVKRLYRQAPVKPFQFEELIFQTNIAESK